MKRGKGFAASPAQREKIAGFHACIACGVERSDYVMLDPAHLCPRSMGGCNEPACVVPLCREATGVGCHAAFDAGELDLSVKLEPHRRKEVAHCVMHLGLFGAVRRITGDRHYGRQAA